MPYSEEDAQFFFGREGEREIITANLMASRLTLLYGVSGVGKTSILRAGVVHHLRQLAQRNLAEHRYSRVRCRHIQLLARRSASGLTRNIQASVTQALNGQAPALVSTPGRLFESLQEWTEHFGGDLLIILDQFEEYFLYHSQEDGEGTFAVELPRAVNRPGLRVNFLVSIRDDALAKLDRFKGRFPAYSTTICGSNTSTARQRGTQSRNRLGNTIVCTGRSRTH